jgi:hypothetical protein
MRFSVRAWADGSGDAAAGKPLPAMLRRRATGLGKRALAAASSLPDTDKARYVLSSRHGEFSRTLAILKALAADEPVSPADFSMSVHHALAALLSIASGNHGGHTAIAAGEESFCFALIEAAARLAEAPDEPVLLLHYDEPLPGEYAAFNPPAAAPSVLALLLENASGPEFSLAMSAKRRTEIDGIPAARAFAAFLGGASAAAEYEGETRHWRFARDEG